jgi:uncharacterized membrane protein YhaH (DUF805 family)
LFRKAGTQPVSKHFRDLWRWDGRVSGRDYFLIGVVALMVKQVVDNALLHIFYSQSAIVLPFWWYWAPFGSGARIAHLTGSQVRFAAVMLLVAIPFLWLGLCLTVRRLRDLGQPVWLVILFFAPVVNLIFFLALCVLPSRPEASREAAPWPSVRTLDSVVPQSKLGSALLATSIAVLLGLGLSLLGLQVLKSYGWGLFVALPFCLGLFAVLVYSYHEEREFGSCVAVALLPIGVIACVLLAVALEGVICVVMAAPLAVGLAFLGGWLGYVIQSTYWSRRTPAMLSMALLLTPSVLGIENLIKPQAPIFAVQSEVIVDAPPEVVWQKVVAFTEIPAPREMLFRAGIAYPIRAEISDHGAGAVRRCVFSTGAFVEPIEVWDEPRLLKFSVRENPAPLNELSPYSNVKPAHLHGYLVSRQGQFLLTALPGGKTRLQGTTWYSDAMWPQAYWHLWSNYIIHRIHMRVLEHIQHEVETGTP